MRHAGEGYFYYARVLEGDRGQRLKKPFANKSFIMSNLTTQTVTHVRHWTDRLFSFRTTRAPALRFRNGQFVMLGLEKEGKPLLRAYSVVSANYEEELEFLSIKVPDGPLTSRLQNIQIGDPILIGSKATGTLLSDHLLPGRNLFLLSTGTGLAPFMSVIRDPETYEKFEKIILVHGVRWVKDLAYTDQIRHELTAHALVGDDAREKLVYIPAVTREPFETSGRITSLIESGLLFKKSGVPAWSPDQDRVMICGGPQMLHDLTVILRNDGFAEGASSKPASYVVEKAFAEK